MAAYESDLTRFIRDLKQKKPELERAQREARAIWWPRGRLFAAGYPSGSSVIRLAFPPAAAVFTLTTRSRSSIRRS